MQKLNKKGFSLAETLLTILIVSLAGIIISGGFGLVSNSYKKIIIKSHADTLLSTTSCELDEYLRYATSIEENPLIFKDASTGYRISFSNSDSDGIIINYYNLENTPVEKVPLLSKESMPYDLNPKIKSLTYSEDIFLLDLSIEIDGEVLASQTIKIRPLNNK